MGDIMQKLSDAKYRKLWESGAHFCLAKDAQSLYASAEVDLSCVESMSGVL